VVSVSDWLKVRSFRFESPETQNKKPKIILISKIHFKKFTVNKQRYFIMFTKLNRVLLASGLAVASAAMLSPAVFAQTITGTSPIQIGALDGEILQVFALTWTPGIATFTIVPSGVITAHSLGSLTATGNVAYRITGVSARDGVLLGADSVQEIPYTLSFDGGGNITPTLNEFEVTTRAANVAITNAPLTLSSPGAALLAPQHYTDTLTLTTKAQ